MWELLDDTLFWFYPTIYEEWSDLYVSFPRFSILLIIDLQQNDTAVVSKQQQLHRPDFLCLKKSPFTDYLEHQVVHCYHPHFRGSLQVQLLFIGDIIYVSLTNRHLPYDVSTYIRVNHEKSVYKTFLHIQCVCAEHRR